MNSKCEGCTASQFDPEFGIMCMAPICIREQINSEYIIVQLNREELDLINKALKQYRTNIELTPYQKLKNELLQEREALKAQLNRIRDDDNDKEK